MKLTKSLLKTLIKEEIEKQDENFMKSLINKFKKSEPPTREERQLEFARAIFDKALRRRYSDQLNNTPAYEPLRQKRDDILRAIITDMREGDIVKDSGPKRAIGQAAREFRSTIRDWERETGNEGEQ